MYTIHELFIRNKPTYLPINLLVESPPFMVNGKQKGILKKCSIISIRKIVEHNWGYHYDKLTEICNWIPSKTLTNDGWQTIDRSRRGSHNGH